NATLKGLKKSTPNNQELLKLNPQAIKYGEMIPEGGSWKDLPYKVLPDRWKKIRDNMAKYHYPKFFRRHFRTDIMGTVTAAFKPENAAVWHPTENRVYSVREIARFQTFPDDFIFYGRNVKCKYSQIGNAVPPLIGEIFGETFKIYLNKVPLSKIPKYEIDVGILNVNKPIHRQEDHVFIN
ncbi:MAG: DNA cytosine methyltransferase, partial [Bacteriovoracaceae bacterium]|nr:DNA cytosine methyltransferase [Bacteriovoracaceae bacterium]